MVLLFHSNREIVNGNIGLIFQIVKTGKTDRNGASIPEDSRAPESAKHTQNANNLFQPDRFFESGWQKNVGQAVPDEGIFTAESAEAAEKKSRK